MIPSGSHVTEALITLARGPTWMLLHRRKPTNSHRVNRHHRISSSLLSGPHDLHLHSALHCSIVCIPAQHGQSVGRGDGQLHTVISLREDSLWEEPGPFFRYMAWPVCCFISPGRSKSPPKDAALPTQVYSTALFLIVQMEETCQNIRKMLLGCHLLNTSSYGIGMGSSLTDIIPLKRANL